MSILKKLFGGGPPPEPPKPETYKDFAITPNPAKEGARYRVGALIEKTVDGEPKSHQLIRADTLDDLDSANTTSISKAKQMIDEQGVRLFG